MLDLDSRQVDSLQNRDATATVLLLTRTDCPIFNRYAPEVQHLHERFAPRGVVFHLVYPKPKLTFTAIQEHVDEFGYTCQPLWDPEHNLVRVTGATVTPEAAVFLTCYLTRCYDAYLLPIGSKC